MPHDISGKHFDYVVQRERKRNMKSTGIVRNIDELGRIVIPKEIRNKMDIASSDPIEIYVDGDKIILTKYHPCCNFCGSEINVTEFKGKKICITCLDEIKNAN
jgi:transcriptional pleiotropic regulator of transition state genes